MCIKEARLICQNKKRKTCWHSKKDQKKGEKKTVANFLLIRRRDVTLFYILPPSLVPFFLSFIPFFYDHPSLCWVSPHSLPAENGQKDLDLNYCWWGDKFFIFFLVPHNATFFFFCLFFAPLLSKCLIKDLLRPKKKQSINNTEQSNKTQRIDW